MMAHWQAQLPASLHCQQAGLANWLQSRSSLTALLRAVSQQFSVQRLRQGPAMPLADEFACLSLHRPQQLLQRDILLICDDLPVIYAHTIVLPKAIKQHWPFFNGLGNRSLGSRLFIDPKVKRGNLQFAKLPANHPLYLATQNAVPQALGNTSSIWARRSLFSREQGTMLVTEVFLPAMQQLRLPT